MEVLLKNGKMSTPLFGLGKKFKKVDIEYLCDFAIFFNKLLTRQQKYSGCHTHLEKMT